MSPDERVSVVVITHNRCKELDRTLCRLAEMPEKPRVIRRRQCVVRRHRGHGALMPPRRHAAAPGALRHAADLLDAHPTLAVVTGSILVEPEGRLDDICWEMAQSPLDRTPGIPGHPLLSFLAGVSIVRREAFLAAGGFSSRLWLGGEEELLASDIARAGWHMSYVPDVVAHHHASRLRDAHLRRRHGIRNTLWFMWLRRPLPSAAIRTLRLLRRLPRDRVTAGGIGDAVRGLPWILRQRDPVPPYIERGYRQLEDMQLNGGARKYVS